MSNRTIAQLGRSAIRTAELQFTSRPPRARSAVLFEPVIHDRPRMFVGKALVEPTKPIRTRTTSMPRSHYDILEVRHDASAEVIKAARQILSAKYHPDKNPSPEATDHFKVIQEAYDVLSDPQQRALYDDQLRASATEQRESRRAKQAELEKARADEDALPVLKPAKKPAVQTPRPARRPVPVDSKTNLTAGYIYVLQNEAFPHLLKIGKTTRSPEERAAELSSTGVPHPFDVLFSWEVSDIVSAEFQVHQALAHVRTNEGRDFFAISPEDAERVIDGILGASPVIPSEITPGGCLGVIVFVAVFWGLMKAFGDANPPANSWSSRLWWILYSFTAISVICIFQTVTVLLFGQKKEPPGKSFVDGIAGLFLFYFIIRFVWSFF